MIMSDNDSRPIAIDYSSYREAIEGRIGRAAPPGVPGKRGGVKIGGAPSHRLCVVDEVTVDFSDCVRSNWNIMYALGLLLRPLLVLSAAAASGATLVVSTTQQLSTTIAAACASESAASSTVQLNQGTYIFSAPINITANCSVSVIGASAILDAQDAL